MNIQVPSMQDLLSAGVHFGHKVSRGHPRMKPYVFGARDGVQIIDLAKSEEQLKIAAEKAYQLGKEGKTLLIVGTKKQAREIVSDLAKQADAFYLNVRWFGGLLTNFESIRKNIQKSNSLIEEQQKGQLSHYTKKEQLLITRKLNKFNYEMGGIASMDKVPDAMFIVDAVSDKTAVKEGADMGVTLIGLTDTNADPSVFTYPIPANDDGIKSIKIICDTVIGAYIEGKKKGPDAVLEIVEDAPKDEKKAAKKDLKEVEAVVEEELPVEVVEEAEAIEEEIEKQVVDESDKKV